MKDRKKCVCICFLCIVLLITACGCGRENVDYGSEAEQTGAETGSESDSGAESGEGTFYTEGIKTALGAEETIRETVETVDGDRLNIYGDVIVPDVKTMNVYRATKREIDAEFIKQLVEAFSDDGKLYSGAEEQLPKSALREPLLYAEKKREELEESYVQAQGEADYDIYRTEVVRYEEQISYYRELYEAAGDTYVPMDYDAWNKDERAVVYHDGVAYYLDIFRHSISCYAVDYVDVFDDLEGDVESVTYIREASFARKSINDAEEQEKIRNVAADFTKGLDIGTFDFTDFQDVDALSFQQIHTETGIDEKQCGYYVHLSRMLDGVRVDASRYMDVPRFDQEPVWEDYVQWYEQHCMADKALEALDLMLDDDFQVIGFCYEGMMSEPEIATANVTLLPYETAKASLLASLEKEPVWNGSSSIWDEDGNVTYYDIENNFSDFELLYFRMENPDKEGEYLIVPAWRLAISGLYDSGDNACLINAIDGSRIDLQDELVEWVEISEWGE